MVGRALRKRDRERKGRLSLIGMTQTSIVNIKNGFNPINHYGDSVSIIEKTNFSF